MRTDFDKTVFISYRRAAAAFIARAVFMDLRAHGFDVFMDVESMDSGTFDTMLLNQIAARSHFVIILAPGTVERCADDNDWVRNEIEHAITMERNIIPLMVNNFSFDGTESYLVGKLSELKRYNGISVPIDFFDEAMERLRNRFLKAKSQPTKQVISTAEQQVITERVDEIISQPIPTRQELTAEHYFGVGYGLQQIGDLRAAITNYDKAVQLNSDYRRAYYNRGLAYHQLKDFDRAAADYEMALQIDPTYAKAKHNLGLLMIEIGRYLEAVQTLTSAIALKPDYASAYFNRSKAYFALGDEENATEDFKVYQRYQPNDKQDEANELTAGQLIYESMTQPLPPDVEIPAPNASSIIAMRTDLGRANSINQDACHYFYANGYANNTSADFGCAIICDGTGEGGEKLASSIVSMVNKHLLTNIFLTMSETPDDEQVPITEEIQQAFEQANHLTTNTDISLTVAVFRAGILFIGHVGDTRAYFVEGDNIEQLTRDHSLVQRLIELDQITSEQALVHPQRNVLYRALGQRSELDVDLLTRRRKVGSKIVLCTQGLWRKVMDDEIRQMIVTHAPQQAADKLIELANKRGSTENITVIII